MTYTEQLQDPRWKARALEIKEAADWRCEDCYRHAKDLESPLEVHHCFYVTWMMLWDYPNELLICVCRECHEFRQQREQAAHIQFAKAMRQMRPAQLDDACWSFSGQGISKDLGTHNLKCSPRFSAKS